MEKKHLEKTCLLLRAAGWSLSSGELEVDTFAPDGSLRRFFRLRTADGRTVVVILPPPDDPSGIREARAAYHIGHHLFRTGAPVPKLYGYDPQSGLLACEDLGSVRLHDLVRRHGLSPQVRSLYRESVGLLARMQVQGARGFDTSWCCDTPYYDRDLMLDRESGYFLTALCRDFLHLDYDHVRVWEECRRLADRAAAVDRNWFLHRDFQSRNIMVHDNRVRFIDFQGGRLGPLAYDLASLVIDPYAALPGSFQEELIDHYLATLDGYVPCDPTMFREEYLMLAIQRNLQILGAFAFLGHRRGKFFFRRFIFPALATLNTLLAKGTAAGYPCLRQLVRQCMEKVEDRPKEVYDH
ncbi:aminoglycoside phosphotransferase family protein [Desulfolithobacter sp.]